MKNELEALREDLRAQQEATRRAEQSAQDLQLQLAAVKSEAGRIDKEYQNLSKQPGNHTSRRAGEIAALSLEWRQTQRDLLQAKRERTAEAARASRKLADLERELIVAVSRTDSARNEASGRRRMMRVGALLATLGAVVLICVAYWPALSGHGATPVVAATTAPAAPSRSSKAVVQQVAKGGHGCPLEWSNGRPTLVFDGGSGLSGSLSATLDQCADQMGHSH